MEVNSKVTMVPKQGIMKTDTDPGSDGPSGTERDCDRYSPEMKPH